jgi:hypothetical protein
MNTQPQQDYACCYVDKMDVVRALGDVWKFIEPALKYGDDKDTRESLVLALKNKKAALWITFLNCEPVAAFITRMELHPTGKRMVVAYAGGDLGAMYASYSTLEDYAVGSDCDAIEVYGRPGWQRVGKPYAYEHISTVCRKKL